MPQQQERHASAASDLHQEHDETASESSRSYSESNEQPHGSKAWLHQLLGLMRSTSQVTVDLEVNDLESSALNAGPTDLSNPAELAHLTTMKLGHPSAEVRQACLELLARDPSTLAAVAEVVIARLSDDVWHVRRAAVEALARLLPVDGDTSSHSASESGSSVLLLLVGKLSDDVEQVRVAAARALRGVVPQRLEEMHLEALVAASQDSSLAVREAALGSLGRLASGRPAGLAAIRDCFGDRVPLVRLAAIEATAAVGAEALAAHKAELAALATGDASSEVRYAAERVLMRAK